MTRQSRDNGVLIIGGGLAAQRCAEGLRSRGYDGRVRIVCGEPEQPYDRPPLSKEMLAGEATEDEVVFRPRDWYADNDVELIVGALAERLDPPSRMVRLECGELLSYDKVLISTGSLARRLPMLAGYQNSQAVRTLADVRRLSRMLEPGVRIAIVGAGFIGQEVAATAKQRGARVTIIEALDTPLELILGPAVGRWFAELHSDEGIELLLGARLEGARGNGRVEELVLADGRRVECDAVIEGVGVAPATEWLAGSGLEERGELSGGVKTDVASRTFLPDVFAAGDAARSFDPHIGEYARTEHWDAAARQGAAAAQAMLGTYPGVPPLPSFWSDQYGARIQYVGHADRADDVVIQGDPAQREFVATYTRDGRPVAGLAVNCPRDIARLRREIALPPKPETESMKARAA